MQGKENPRVPVILVGEEGRFVQVNPKDPDIIDVNPTEVTDHMLLGEPAIPGEEIMLPRPRVSSGYPLLRDKNTADVEGLR